MSEAGKNWRVYLDEMITSATKITNVISDYDYARFVKKDITYDGLLMNLQIIGENARKIPEDVKDRYDLVPWQQTVFMRHMISHDYNRVSIDVVWDTLIEDVPILLDALLIIASKEQDHGL